MARQPRATGGLARSRSARPGPAGGLARSKPPRPAPARGLEEAWGPRAAARLEQAARAYAEDRYGEALRLLRRLSSELPADPAVKELLGLTFYRLGRWEEAVRALVSHHRLSGSYDQFPVLADCYRAMRRYEESQAVWDELRKVSPGAAVMAEGRIVEAELLADQGDLRGAIKLLEATASRPGRGGGERKVGQLRQWYALADLYERAGELPRARELFNRVAAEDPYAYDVRQRLGALK